MNRVRDALGICLAVPGLVLLVSAAVFGWPYVDSVPHGGITLRLTRSRAARGAS